MTLKTFQVGEVLSAADVNEYLENNRFAVKPSDTSRISTATLANDPDLSVTADANKYYDLLMNLAYVSPTAAGFRLAVTVPSGTVFTGYMLSLNGNTGTVAGVNIFNAVAGQLSLAYHLTSFTGAAFGVTLCGTLDTAGTGGAVTLQWCQDTLTGTNTTLNAGSSLRLRRVA